MKSLELNWIRKKVDKSIPIPEVVYHPLDKAGGKYYQPNNCELYDPDGKPYLMRYGVIVIDPEYEPFQSTIAHEWRHHWQYYNGIKFDISPIDLFDNFDYDTALLKYFTESNTEQDAVRFQYKHVGFFGEYEEWEKSLYPVLKDLMVHPIITYGNTTLNKQKIHSCSSISRYPYKIDQKTRRV